MTRFAGHLASIAMAAMLALIVVGPYVRPLPALAGDVPAAAAEMGLADRWDDLSDAEKKRVLERYERFKSLPPERQKRMRENYEKYRTLSPEEKARLKKRLDRLRNLPPDKRKQLEDRLERWRRMSPEERERVRERVKRFRELPPEVRESIRKRSRELRDLPPEQRDEKRRELREELRKRGIEPRGGNRHPSDNGSSRWRERTDRRKDKGVGPGEGGKGRGTWKHRGQTYQEDGSGADEEQDYMGPVPDEQDEERDW